MKLSKLSSIFWKGPSGVAPRVMFGSFPPEHAEFADMYLTNQVFLLCKKNVREAGKEQ